MAVEMATVYEQVINIATVGLSSPDVLQTELGSVTVRRGVKFSDILMR